MMSWSSVVLTCLLFRTAFSAHYIPIIDEQFVDCGHSGYIDLHGIELVAVNDTVSGFAASPSGDTKRAFLISQHTYLNGKIHYKKEIHSPWTVKISSLRFDRGEWHMGEINRRITDMCLVLQDSLEPWYPITSRMKHKTCPIPAGVGSNY